MVKESRNQTFLVIEMSHEDEKIKKLVNFKGKIEKKMEELEDERIELQTILEVLNEIIITKGFKPARIVKQTVIIKDKEKGEVKTKQSSYLIQDSDYDNFIELKTKSGEPLASLYLKGDTLRLVLVKDKKFRINTSPFTNFLVEKVLKKMQEKDRELAKEKIIKPDKIFAYNITQKDGVIDEIVINNVNDKRFKELKSSFRWTLERMYEKL